MPQQSPSPTGTPPLRFGLQVNPAPADSAEVAQAAEQAGFDVITVADHIGSGSGSPLIRLMAMAEATDHIHIGTMVLNNDMRNPVQLAWEAVTLQRLSGGRFELGLGAGHTPHEYAETGLVLDPPAIRKQRLCEAVEIIGALTRGETVDFAGHHYEVNGAVVTDRPVPLPILVGGNGTALLSHAARHADAIGLQGLGRTLEDGHRHTVKFGIDHLESQLDTIAGAADGRSPELAALIQLCTITDDREASLRTAVDDIDGLAYEDAARTPYFAVGSVDEIAQQFITARDEWGISYFTVRSMDLSPIIARVRELENGG